MNSSTGPYETGRYDGSTVMGPTGIMVARAQSVADAKSIVAELNRLAIDRSALRAAVDQIDDRLSSADRFIEHRVHDSEEFRAFYTSVLNAVIVAREMILTTAKQAPSPAAVAAESEFAMKLEDGTSTIKVTYEGQDNQTTTARDSQPNGVTVCIDNLRGPVTVHVGACAFTMSREAAWSLRDTLMAALDNNAACMKV